MASSAQRRRQWAGAQPGKTLSSAGGPPQWASFTAFLTGSPGVKA